MSKPQTKAELLTPQGVDGFEPQELARDSSGWSVCWLLCGLVIKYPFGWDQKLYYPLRAHLWILAFWTNDWSSAGLSAVRGCFPNTNFESSPIIWTHGGPWKIVFEGLESMRSSDNKWQGLSRLLKRNVLRQKTKEVHTFRTCLWIKTHPNRFLRERRQPC